MNFDFIYRGESKEIDEAVRASTSGSFIRISNGFTHYELSGAESGPPVVLVHGFSAPYFIFDPTFDFLVTAGYHVLRYDLFGRGFSDRPRVAYNIGCFVQQLKELLDAWNFPQVSLLGLSMGGAITSAFTVSFPRRIHRLILIDPIGTQPMPLSWIYRAAVLPGISELILGLAGTERMVQGIAADFFNPEHVKMFQDQYRVQMQYRGFKRAILSTLRNKTVDGFPEVYRRLGKLDIPVLLLWGRNDQTLPLDQSHDILSAVPRAEYHVIECSGHIPHYEKPEEVNRIIQEFLNSK
ncbi:MAG TPA: alpha/beta hydrolase [Anaerolineales bacterium]|nr:alpha/beta hydrolase [Anaerolineales bacterium]